MKNIFASLSLCIALLTPLASLHAEDAEKKDEYVIVIKDHIFNPANLIIPANEKVKLVVDNQDATPEEFESHDLHREKVIRGNSKGIIYVGPLEPGIYNYFGEFNEDTAKGTITAQ